MLCVLRSQMAVTWTIGSGAGAPPQYVQFGTQSGVYTTTLPAAKSITYTSSSMCGLFTAVNSFLDPGRFVTAVMTGLAPATKYYYRVGALDTVSHPCWPHSLFWTIRAKCF